MESFSQGDTFSLVIKKFRKDRLLVAKRAACGISFCPSKPSVTLGCCFDKLSMSSRKRNIQNKLSNLGLVGFFKRHDITIESPAMLMVYREQNFVSCRGKPTPFQHLINQERKPEEF